MAESPQDILKKYWGYDDFIHPQSLIIQSVLAGKDTFALLPTGGGKSITFQVPIMLLDGICIVVSPLIALMKDQVTNLKSKGIKAELITSELLPQEINVVLDNCRYGGVKLLYISPERLQSNAFQENLKTLKIAYFAIDEAHCIVEWGHDFRPSYLALHQIREMFPDIPILALTATATPKIQDEIIQQLNLKNVVIHKKSLQRKNLAYRVVNSQDKWNDILYYLQKIKGASLIFCRTRKDTYQLSQFLKENNWDADFYHARLSKEEKNAKQEAFIKSDNKILVCTNAFGMGIDKPNVRLVIHENAPDSIESYFQEVGRGGRDGFPATGILLYNEMDKKNALKTFRAAHPDKDTFLNIIRKLYNFYQIADNEKRDGQIPFSEKKFREQYDLPKKKTKTVLQFLEQKKIIAIHTTQRNSLAKILVENYKILSERDLENQVINFIARHYAGIFQKAVTIDENFIAKRLNKPTFRINQTLRKLNESGKIFYRDAVIIKISFLEPRNDQQTKVSLWKVFMNLQQIKWNRLLAMHYFAENQTICKSQLLLQYFGEKHTAQCGVCNVCRSLLGKKEISENDILNLIAQQEITMDDILQHFIHNDKKFVLEQVQYLLDEEKIKLKLPNIYYI